MCVLVCLVRRTRRWSCSTCDMGLELGAGALRAAAASAPAALGAAWSEEGSGCEAGLPLELSWPGGVDVARMACRSLRIAALRSRPERASMPKPCAACCKGACGRGL